MQGPDAHEPHPLAQIAVGVAIALVVFGVPLACTSGTFNARWSCYARALEVLPEDPMMATVYDAVDVIRRKQECDRELAAAADGGAQ